MHRIGTRRYVVIALCLAFAASVTGEVYSFLDSESVPNELPVANTLELSLEDCVMKALELNYSVEISRQSARSSEAGVLRARGTFEPVLFGDAGVSSSTSVDTNDVSDTSETESGRLGVSTKLITGTDVSISADYSESDHDEIGSASVGVTLTQPLLRDAGIKTTRSSLIVARRKRDISVYEFTQQLIDTASAIQDLYWNLLSAREQHAVQEESLKYARDLRDLTMHRADAGLMAESDTVEAEAAFFSREASVVRSAESVRALEDSVKETLTLFENPDYWNAAIIPTSKPEIIDTEADFLRALHTALARRPDYQSTLLRLKNSDLSLYLAKNGLLPKLDLVASGSRSDDADGPGNAFNAVSNDDEQVWSIFLRLEIPLGNKSERADLRQARATRQQQLLGLKQLELRIIREVRRAADALNTSRLEVENTKKAMGFEERKLENEKTKLELGKSSTDNVVRFIQSLNSARLRHIQSVVSYNQALVRFEKVRGTTLDKYGVIIEDEL